VVAENGLDSKEWKLVIKVLPSMAGSISGNPNVCHGQDSEVYSVPLTDNATSYSWTLPEGAKGTSTTNQISVKYGMSAISGNITVKGCNSWGEGSESTLKITVNPKPVSPIITIDKNILHSNVVDGNQWYNHDEIINGATSQNFSINKTGDYYSVVTINGCASEPSNKISYISTGIHPAIINDKIKVHPNPISNVLNIEIEDKISCMDFELINSNGQTIIRNTFSGRIAVHTSNIPCGIYILKIGNGYSYEFLKILKE